MNRSILPLALLFASVMFGQSSANEPSDCADIDKDARRLECYDLLFRKSVDRSQEASRWNVQVEQSKIDDSRNVFLYVDSLEPIRNQFGQASNGNLVISCRENETSLWFKFGGHFMSDLEEGGRITYRVDKQVAKSKSFTESTNYEALGLWSGGVALPFIKELFGANVLLVRATPYSESPVTMEFPISGLEGAIDPLREACHW